MRCPQCGSEKTKIIKTHPRENGATVTRRRVCYSCGHRFRTREQIVGEHLRVVPSGPKEEEMTR